VHWLVEPGGPSPKGISVGEITFHPHCGEPEHAHHSEEHVLYVISGQGAHTVNGRHSPLRKGDMIYMPPYCTHAMTNTGTEDLLLLCIYSYQKAPAPLMTPAPAAEDPRPGLELASIIDPKIVGPLLDNLSQALKLSLRLVDEGGRELIESAKPPNLCRHLSQCGDHCRRHIAQAIEALPDRRSSHFMHCCGQVSTLIVPVLCGPEVCGYLKCGEFFISRSDRMSMAQYLAEYSGFLAEPDLDSLLSDLTVEKKSRLHSAVETASAVGNYIVENAQAMLRQRELAEHRLSVVKEQMTTATLERALREADFKLLQSQINPHFLFNTLNIISQTAYMEGADTAAGLICNLADLMRATLRKANHLVPLREEHSLLKNYLAIQKARFGERLEVSLDIEDGLDEVPLPILILQPLVENAIVHGLETRLDTHRVEIVGKRIPGGRVSLSVSDDGAGFPQDKSPAEAGLGLKSIEARLRHFFNTQFTFDIQSRPGRGAVIEITVPDKRPDAPEPPDATLRGSPS
jgi:quercetin dioxygenase-like cupin family protein/ligand-binding sensor protein